MNSLLGYSNQYDQAFGLYLSKVKRMPILAQDTFTVNICRQGVGIE